MFRYYLAVAYIIIVVGSAWRSSKDYSEDKRLQVKDSPLTVVVLLRRFFNKEDERLLSNLLKKVKTHTEEVDKGAAVTAKTAEEAALRQIVGKYKISKEDFDAIIGWKHSHY